MKTETTRAGEFLVSEANGQRSRETITLTGGPFVAGQVLSVVTASGKYAAYTGSGSSGTETAAAVLYRADDGSGGDVEAVAIVRDAEVSKELLVGGGDDANKNLAAVGIIAR
ncbi:MAG: head decoration protein [Marinobacter sp.]